MIAPAPTRIKDREALVALSRLVQDGQTEEEKSDATDVKPRFVLHTLLADVARHEELDLDTLTYHARQSDATAADGYWHASINEARSFLEALLVGILYSVCAKEAHKQKGMSRNSTPFRGCRRRLLEAGFLDVDENDLLQYVYSIASAKGSHHGATDEAWTRLARRMVWTASEYLLMRYEAWKSGGTKPRFGTLDRTSRFGLSGIRQWAARCRDRVLGCRDRVRGRRLASGLFARSTSTLRCAGATP